MTRDEAVAMIDEHKNKMIDPIQLLNWTWIRVIINNVSDDEWDRATERAVEIMSR